MGLRMIANRVAAACDLANQIGMTQRALADEKEQGLHLMPVEEVEKSRRGFRIGTIING